MNIDSIVRSVVVLAVGLPLTLSLGGLVGSTAGLLNSSAQEERASIQQDLKAELTKDCLVYAMTEEDSKLERQAKENIDAVFGGEVVYDDVCAWVLR